MKTLLPLALLLPAFLAPSPAMAQSAFPGCLGAQLDDQASLECATAEASRTDQALQDAYNASLEAAGDDSSVVFRRYAHASFLTFRGSNCAFYNHTDDLPGQVAAKLCESKMNTSRIRELEAGMDWVKPGKGK